MSGGNNNNLASRSPQVSTPTPLVLKYLSTLPFSRPWPLGPSVSFCQDSTEPLSLAFSLVRMRQIRAKSHKNILPQVRAVVIIDHLWGITMMLKSHECHFLLLKGLSLSLSVFQAPKPQQRAYACRLYSYLEYALVLLDPTPNLGPVGGKSQKLRLL